jgi:DNA-binding NarL/FixJ family response regulator
MFNSERTDSPELRAKRRALIEGASFTALHRANRRVPYVALSDGTRVPERSHVTFYSDVKPLSVTLVFEVFEGELRFTGMSQESTYHELPLAGDGMGASKGLRASDLLTLKQKTIDQAIEFVKAEGPFKLLEEDRNSGVAFKGRRRPPGPKGPTEAQLDEVARLRARGKSLADIASRVDKSRTTVRDWLKKWDELQGNQGDS